MAGMKFSMILEKEEDVKDALSLYKMVINKIEESADTLFSLIRETGSKHLAIDNQKIVGCCFIAAGHVATAIGRRLAGAETDISGRAKALMVDLRDCGAEEVIDKDNLGRT